MADEINDTTNDTAQPDAASAPATPAAAKNEPAPPTNIASNGPEASTPPVAPNASAPPSFGGGKEADMRSAGGGVGENAAPTSAANMKPKPQSRASWLGGHFRDLAENLAGGARYKTTVDVNTGVTKREAVPLSSSEIGMAIALEALTGGLAGLGARGPNHIGQAADRGAQAGQRIAAQRQQEQTQQDQQAQNDFARHYQVTESNMRLWNLGLTAGRENQEFHEKWLKDDADHINYIRENEPDKIGAEHVSETEAMDINKYPMNEFYRKVDGYVPRYGEDGKPVYLDQFGKPTEQGAVGSHPALDNTYAMIHKSANFAASDADGKPRPWVQRAVYWNLLPKGWTNQKMGANASLPGASASVIEHKAAVLDATNTDLNRYFGLLNSEGNKNAALKPVEIKDDKIASMVDTAAKKYSLEPSVLRALVMVESGANPSVVSPKGAVGLGQLMPATAKRYGVSDPTDPEQNIDGAAHYLSDLVKQKGDVKSALAAYHGIGSDGITTHDQYVAKIADMTGLGAKATGGDEKFTAPDLRQAIQDDPTLASALDKFNAVYNRIGSYEQSVNELGKKDPKAAGKIANLYGGRDAMHEYDQMRVRSDDAAKKRQDIALDVEKENSLRPGKVQTAKEEAAGKEQVEGSLPQGSMSAADALKEEPVKGVRQNFLTSLPAEDQSIIKAIGEGRDTNVSAYALGRSARAQRIKAEVNLAYPGYDFSRAPAYEATRMAFTKGQPAEGINPLNTALSHMKVMYDSAGWLESLPITSSAERFAGNQKAIDLENSKTALVDELGKAYKAGALTIEDKKSWENRIKVWSPKEIRGNAKSFIDLLDGKLKSYAHQWKVGSAPGGVAPIQIMSDDAIDAYKHISGHEPPAEVTAVGRVTNGEIPDSQSKNQNQQPQALRTGKTADNRPVKETANGWVYADTNQPYTPPAAQQ